MFLIYLAIEIISAVFILGIVIVFAMAICLVCVAIVPIFVVFCIVGMFNELLEKIK